MQFCYSSMSKVCMKAKIVFIHSNDSNALHKIKVECTSYKFAWETQKNWIFNWKVSMILHPRFSLKEMAHLPYRYRNARHTSASAYIRARIELHISIILFALNTVQIRIMYVCCKNMIKISVIYDVDVAQ